MTSHANIRLVSRLADLRLRKETLARQELAKAHALLTSSDQARAQEEARYLRMQRALTSLYKLHIHQTRTMARPVDRFATLVAAVQGDRLEVDVQAGRAEAARTHVRKLTAELEALRQSFLQASRRRQATEALAQVGLRNHEQQQVAREEDAVGDIAFGSWKGEAK